MAYYAQTYKKKLAKEIFFQDSIENDSSFYTPFKERKHCFPLQNTPIRRDEFNYICSVRGIPPVNETHPDFLSELGLVLDQNKTQCSSDEESSGLDKNSDLLSDSDFEENYTLNFKKKKGIKNIKIRSFGADFLLSDIEKKARRVLT